jgi:predicted regulator of amino acid metabolism with ACT domain
MKISSFEYIDKYAAKCGVAASSVYFYLNCHADSCGAVNVSKEDIAETIGISVRSVYSAIKRLLKYQLIHRTIERDCNGKFASYKYFI